MSDYIYAVGDIHGHIDKLRNAIDLSGVDLENDKIVFLGDYIDRGKDSFDVMGLLISIRNNNENAVFLPGNHEFMFYDFLRGRKKDLFLYNGGFATLKSYGYNIVKSIPSEHYEFLKHVVKNKYHETDEYYFVHAGFECGKEPTQDDQVWDMVWIRDDFILDKYRFKKVVVHGHTPTHHVLERNGRICIDTGAGGSGPVTILRLPDMKYFQGYSDGTDQPTD